MKKRTGEIMKVRVEGIAYEGTGLEIMEHLRLRFFPELSDTEDYIQQVRCNFIRASDMDCVIPGNVSPERQARTVLSRMAEAGALEMLNNA